MGKAEFFTLGEKTSLSGNGRHLSPSKKCIFSLSVSFAFPVNYIDTRLNKWGQENDV